MTRFFVSASDPAKFSSMAISEIRHNFHEHPLMSLPALAELAKELAVTEQCRFITPGATQGTAFHHKSSSADGRAIEEVFARIAEPASWVALYNIETCPRYKAFLAEVIAAGRHLIDPTQSGIHNAQGFVFISAPPSVTPFHIDRENNFWLQIHGHKTMNVWDHRDRETVEAGFVEEFIMTGSLRNVGLKQDCIPRSRQFDTKAGTGVYFPSTSPHMTRTETGGAGAEDDVSISIGVVFYTATTRKQANVHIVNYYLRRMGLRPRDPGQSAFVDGLKYPLGRSIVMVEKRLRGYKPKPGIEPF